MSPAFQTVALIGKYKSPGIAEPLLELAKFLKHEGLKVLVDRLTATHLGPQVCEVHTLEEIGVRADLAIVVGGDGTMLNIARTLAPHGVALVGVNQGRLGFLTDISVHTMFETMGHILAGKFVTESRMLLAAEVVSGDDAVFS